MAASTITSRELISRARKTKRQADIDLLIAAADSLSQTGKFPRIQQSLLATYNDLNNPKEF